MKSETPPKKTAPNRGVRETPEVRQQAIIDATMRCIAQFSYSETTIERICAEAKISRGLINHHFATKDELMAQTYKRLADNLKAESRRAVLETAGSAMDKLTTLIRVCFQPPIFAELNLAVWLGFWSVVRTTPALQQMHAQLYASYRKALAGIFDDIAAERGQPVDSRRAALTLTALIDGFWLEWSLDPTAFDAAEAEASCLFVAHQLLAADRA